MLWLLYSLSLLPLVLGAPEVTTSQGVLRGSVLRSRGKRDFFAFTKIPYAEPPLGTLRFMPPSPAKNWTGVLDATQPSPHCYQGNPQKNTSDGQEDCLYLNVYTPKISDASLPVMIYLTGGLFAMGYAPSARSSSYFMDEDVVLVTLNFRLGRLGFLSLEDDTIPGNMGLKDQALALEWVKREIGAFGGNPNLITAFGDSSGGASAHYLCSSRRTSDLLKGCISQSGVAGVPDWTLRKAGETRKSALELGKSLGCLPEQFLSCMQSKTVEEVMRFFSGSREVEGFMPVVEPPSKHAIITSSFPEKRDFPWITGITADEGMIFTGFYEYLIPNFPPERYVNQLKKMITYRLDLQNRTSDVQRIMDRFINNTPNPYLGGRKFGTEAFFLYPALNSLERHTGPKFFYIFDYRGGPSFFEFMENKDFNITGVCHHDEYPYFFDTLDKFRPQNWPGPEDILLSEGLIKTWVAFAKEQSPKKTIPHWKNYDDNNYLYIGNAGITMKQMEDTTEILKFWKDIF